MGKKREVIVAKKRHVGNGEVVPDVVLSEKPFREIEHAFHALPHLALRARLNTESVGVFCHGQLITSQTQMVV